MAAVRLRWSTLFNLSELEFVPEAPKQLKVSDELQQAISWLTGATGHDRKLLRCTEQGALLVADGWSNLLSVETDELYPQSASTDTYTAGVDNQGVLVATSTELVLASFVRGSGKPAEDIYIPANWEYWYPHKVYSIELHTVPDSDGTASYVGITAFN